MIDELTLADGEVIIRMAGFLSEEAVCRLKRVLMGRSKLVICRVAVDNVLTRARDR